MVGFASRCVYVHTDRHTHTHRGTHRHTYRQTLTHIKRRRVYDGGNEERE
jgi:hypothetical protein